MAPFTSTSTIKNFLMSIKIQVVRSFQRGFKPFIRQISVGKQKHTSAVTDKFNENHHVHNEINRINLDESSKMSPAESQPHSDVEIYNSESKLLKEMLLTKDALIHKKDFLLHSKDFLLHSKDFLHHSKDALLYSKDALLHSKDALLHSKDAVIHKNISLMAPFTSTSTIKNFLMSIKIQVVRSFQRGFKPFIRQISVGKQKHTSAVTDKFNENHHVHNEINLDESSKMSPAESQPPSDVEIYNSESKLLKEMLLTKDAIIHCKDLLLHSKDFLLHSKDFLLHSKDALLYSKDALLHSKDALLHSKDALIHSKDLIIRSFLESELLGVKYELHCRGVIERFEVLRSSDFIGHPKMTRFAVWNKILNSDIDLQISLSELKGFPSSVSSSSVPVVIAKLITEFYRRLSNDIYRDPCGQTVCIINEEFCSDWEMGFMVKICKSIPVRHIVENANQPLYVDL